MNHLIDPVIYGDVFDYSVSIDDIERFCELPMVAGQLAREIRDSGVFSRVVGVREGCYFLRGREELVELRRSRQQISQNGWRRARRVVSLIRYTPFVRGILVTGSLAVDNARHRDDIDFLVITSAGRLWFVFAVLGTLQRIVSRRFLCPNYYITIDHLQLSRKSHYVAREAVQARPIFGAEACRRFWKDNEWVTSFFPNAGRAQEPPGGIMERRAPFAAISGLVEWVFVGWLGQRLEGLLKKVLMHRLWKHYGLHGQTVPEKVTSNAVDEVELRFHGLKHERSIVEAVRLREKHVEELLSTDGEGLAGSS